MRRWLSIAPAVLVAVAGAVLIAYQWSGGRPLWVDEEMIAINIRDRSFADLTGTLWLGQSAPLGWLIVERIAFLAAGHAEQTLRLVPGFFGIATLAAAVWVGHRWMTAAGAFVLAALCAGGLWISFFPLELKHYSADAFFGLMIPALGAWVFDAADRARTRRRGMIWWAVAVAGTWLSNGGLLALPGCALLLAAAIWKKHGGREAARFGLGGSVWLLSFAAYYDLSLSYTHHNRYLRDHWNAEVLPAGSTVGEALSWMAARFEPLARNPGGAASWALLWVGAIAGLVLAKPRMLAALFATLPLAAFTFAAIGLVPLYERFSLWMVPALYIGLALLADRAALLASAGLRARRILLLPAAALGVIVTIASADVVAGGASEIRQRLSFDTNHGHHDRDAVAWLLAQRRPGDAVLTTRLGWPAVWWYGRMRPEDARLHEGMFQVGYRPPGRRCRPEELGEGLQGYTRALVHVGFPDIHEGYGDLLLRHLDDLGAVAGYRAFGHLGFVAIVDLHTAGREASSLDLLPRPEVERDRIAGCISIGTPRLW